MLDHRPLASLNALRDVERDARSAKHGRALAADLKKLVDQLDAFASKWLSETTRTRVEQERLHVRFWNTRGEEERKLIGQEAVRRLGLARVA